MEAADSVSQLLAFQAGDRRFAVPAERVREVARIRPLTPVPQAPHSLLGLGNFRGEAIPVVSVARLLGFPTGSEKQLVVIDGDHPTALAIDRIDGVVSTEADCEQPAFDDLLLEAFPTRKTAAVRAQRSSAQSDSVEEEHLELLGFAIGDQLFALPLAAVENILRVPPNIASFPHADAATIGSIEWRGQVVPLFSLASLLDLPSNDGREARVLIAKIGRHYLGLKVDRIEALLRPSLDTVDVVPAALLRGETEAVIQAIHRPADGGRLVSILAADQLLREDITTTLQAASPTRRRREQRSQVETEPLLLIQSAGQRFAFPLDAVHQIARVPATFTAVANVPSFLVGLTSFRGEALPVVDLSTHLSKKPVQGDKTRLLVVTVAGSEAALLVDLVEGIVHAPKDVIIIAPPAGDARTAPIGRVIELDQGAAVTLVLSPDDLFEQLEADLVSEVSRGSAKRA